MRSVVLATVLLAGAAGIPARVRAQGDAPGSDSDSEGNDDSSAGVVLDNAAFEQRLAQSEALVRNSQPTVHGRWLRRLRLLRPARATASGYVEDFGHVYFPQYGGQFGWVFLGDILAPAVNSRGEVADLGPAPGVDRGSTASTRAARRASSSTRST